MIFLTHIIQAIKQLFGHSGNVAGGNNTITPFRNNASSGVIVVTTVSQLSSYSGTSTLIFLSDAKRGGYFNYRSTGYTTNDGVAFSATGKGGGHWVRYFEPGDGVNPYWFGAVGDGSTDDLAALNSTVTYALTNKLDIAFPSGVFRVTDTWIVGFKFIGESEMNIPSYTSGATYSSTERVKARTSERITIRGSGNTVIWGDFTSASGLKAIVYYGILSGGQSTKLLQEGSRGFDGITIAAQEAIVAGSYTNTGLPNASNNQIGICAHSSVRFRATNITVIGMKVGMFGHSLYQSDISNVKALFCKFGSYFMDHAVTKISNYIGDHCTEGLYIQGSPMIVVNPWLNVCNVGLRISGETELSANYTSENVTIENIYCEEAGATTTGAQIIVGDTVTENNSNLTNTVVFKGMVGSAGTGNYMMLLGNVGKVTVEGCNTSNNPAVNSLFEHASLIVRNSATKWTMDGPARIYNDNEGGLIGSYRTDVIVGGSTETDIFSSTVGATVMLTNENRLRAEYEGNFVSVGTEAMQLKTYFAGSSLWDSGAVVLPAGTTSWKVVVDIVRTNLGTIRATTTLITTNNTTFNYCTYTQVSGLTTALLGSNIIKITGTSTGTGSGVGDIVGRMGNLIFTPYL
jgi:hypothetical protein